MPKTWVYAEVNNGKVLPAALEILTKARDLDGELEAVALGPGATEAAAKLGEYGATTVFASDDDVYVDHVAQPNAHALNELVKEHSPDLILFPMSYDSRDIAGRLSGKTGATLMSNITDLLGPDTAQTAIFGGTTLVDVKLDGQLRLGLVRPKSFPAEPGGSGDPKVVPVEVEIADELKKATRTARHEREAEGPK